MDNDNMDLEAKEMFLRPDQDLRETIAEIKQQEGSGARVIVIRSFWEEIESDKKDEELDPATVKELIKTMEKRPDLFKHLVNGELKVRLSDTCIFSQQDFKGLDIGYHIGTCNNCFDEMMRKKKQRDQEKRDSGFF